MENFKRGMEGVVGGGEVVGRKHALGYLLRTFTVYQLLLVSKVYKVITPWNVGVSTKHILSLFDDGNRVIFLITAAVEFTV